MSNKKAGNDFEAEFCQMLARAGFWAHNMANRKNGQPADVIAVRGGSAYLIDCKDCQRDIFEFSRIEDNQAAAMERWRACKNYGGCWFALKMSDGVYMIQYERGILCLRDRGKNSIKKGDNNFFVYVWRFDEWAEKF